MSETKLCPMQPFTASENYDKWVGVGCLQERCAWWVEGAVGEEETYLGDDGLRAYYRPPRYSQLPGHCAILDIGRKP